MKTKCRDCGTIFETQGNETDEGTCYACALGSLTGGRPPETEDITTAYFISREMTKAEWREFQAELRRYHPGDFYEEEPEWCHPCDSYTCHCLEREKEDKRREEKWEMDNLYFEAVEEDQERQRDTEEASQQAKWDAEIAEREAVEVREQEWYNTFSPLLFDIFGWTKYNQFVAPVLIGMRRLKQRWLH